MQNINLSNVNVSATNELVFDRIVKEKERRLITSISRSEAFQLERKGLFPLRRKISNRSVGWLLSELLNWVNTREKAITAGKERAL